MMHHTVNLAPKTPTQKKLCEVELRLLTVLDLKLRWFTTFSSVLPLKASGAGRVSPRRDFSRSDARTLPSFLFLNMNE